jgi:hypothetical protein
MNNTDKFKNDNTGLPRPQGKEKFLKGPIPWWWLERLAEVGGRSKTFIVGIGIWQVAEMRKSNEFKMQPGIYKDLGVSSSSFHRALRLLKQGGLIDYSVRSGRSPNIEILGWSEDSENEGGSCGKP